MKIDNDIIRGHIWQKILLLAFHPSGQKDQAKWLYLYTQSLKDYWEISYQDNPKNIKNNFSAKLSCSLPSISINYNIEDIDKFAFTFNYQTGGQKVFEWIHDVDGKYFSLPTHKLLTHHKTEHESLKHTNKEYLKSVTDAILFHPKVHMHIEHPSYNYNKEILPQHDVRISGGIDNPFLFLFHLRYQLCCKSKKREDEKERLIDLFLNAIKNKKSSIPTNELMGIKDESQH